MVNNRLVGRHSADLGLFGLQSGRVYLLQVACMSGKHGGIPSVPHHSASIRPVPKPNRWFPVLLTPFKRQTGCQSVRRAGPVSRYLGTQAGSTCTSWQACGASNETQLQSSHEGTTRPQVPVRDISSQSQNRTELQLLTERRIQSTDYLDIRILRRPLSHISDWSPVLPGHVPGARPHLAPSIALEAPGHWYLPTHTARY